MAATVSRAALHRRWPLIKRLLTLAFFAAVTVFVVMEARHVDWSAVLRALSGIPPSNLAMAAVFAAASHALFSTFDLMGRRYTGHKLATSSVIGVNFISYAFNLNFGALIGGVAFRYRLYTRLGLGVDHITKVVSLSMITNWLGYMLLAGIALCWQSLPLPEAWAAHGWILPGIGVLMIAAAIAYVALCAASNRREFRIRNHVMTLPSFRMAVLQLVVSCANWLLMVTLIYTLLQQRIAFPVVAFALLAAAVAGVVTHVPAGIGVIEAVFIALLSGYMPREQLLASLLIYRFLYYLVPLAIAIGLYVSMEVRARQLQVKR